MVTTVLDLTQWQQAGYICLDSFLSGAALEELRAWVDEIEAWPTVEGKWLQYDELTDAGPRRARTENFAPFHVGMHRLLTDSPIVQMASDLLCKTAVLYKEKINYKHPGGAGFAPHQDQAAYPNISRSVTCLLAIDDATVANGCLEFAAGMHQAMLPLDAEGCIAPDVAASLDWVPVPAPAGSLIWFHCFTPHRSGPNRTAQSRRALYVTYNPLLEGDLRAAYYAGKAQVFAEMGTTTGVGTERISLISHFRGRPIPRVQHRA
jgi:hypothetical protein